MKVAVLTGGSSTERELSLASAKNVCAALEEAGHRTVLLDASSDLVSALRVERPDVCFNALHGKLGEDGTVQSLLEFVGVPFVGSPSSVCRRAWDKSSLGSEMAAYRAITGDEPTASWPQGVCIAREAFESMGAATAFDLVEDRVIGGYPVAVKPAHGVSASGVRRVDSVDQLGEAVSDALSFDDAVIIEQWIDGVEVTVPVLGSGWDAYAGGDRGEGGLLRYGRLSHAGRGRAVRTCAPRLVVERRGRCPGHPCRNRARRLGSVPCLSGARPRPR